MTKLQGQIVDLAKGTIPPQRKPFKLPFESEIWYQEIGEADTMEVIVKSSHSDTLGEVAERLHMEYLSSMGILNLEIQQRRVKLIKESVGEEAFVTICLALAQKEREAVVQMCDSVRLEFWEDFEADVKRAATRIYLDQTRKVAGDNMVAEDKKVQQKTRAAEALKKATFLPKEELLRRGLAEVLEFKHKGRRKKYFDNQHLVDFSKLINVAVAQVTEDALRSNLSEQKNGPSPAAGRGKNQNEQRAGKKYGKGKGKGPPAEGNKQAKGRGKTSNQQQKNQSKG